MVGLHIITLVIFDVSITFTQFLHGKRALAIYIEGENNNTLTGLLQNHNSEEEFDNSTLNFDKHFPYYDHKSF